MPATGRRQRLRPLAAAGVRTGGWPVGDLKLFRIENGAAVELPGAALALEKPLQVLIENNMEVLFGRRRR